MRNGRVLGTVAVVVVSALAWATAAPAQSGVQSATSPGGAYAWGTGKASDSSGTAYLRFDATFVDPDGDVVGTGPSDGLDLAKTVGVLQVDHVTPPSGPGTWGSTRRICAASANLKTYSRGTSVPARNADGTQGIAWTGLWFDIECRSEFQFDFFRVHFDHGLWRGEPFAAERFEPRETELRTSKGRGSVGPETETPYLYTGGRPIEGDVYRHWSAPGRLGTITAEPLIRQGADLTLCGYRDGVAARCWKGESVGLVFAATAGLTHTVHPW